MRLPEKKTEIPPSSFSPPFPEPKHDPDEKRTMISASENTVSGNLRGKALVAAIETGLLKENEDGSVNIRTFNRFWYEIEKIIYQSWSEKGGQGFNKIFRTSDAGE